MTKQQEAVIAAPAPASPAAQWEDHRVQKVYEILCRDDAPPPGEHWEGFQARLIVDAICGSPAPSASAQPAEPVEGKTKALFDLRRLPAVTINEIDGEESDGTPKTWRRPYVSRRRVEELLDALYAAPAPIASPADQGQLVNPYAAHGSLEEAWHRGFHGERGLAAPGSNYDKVWHEGAATRKAYDAGRAAMSATPPAE